MGYQSYTQQQREKRVNYWRPIIEGWRNDGAAAKEYCKARWGSLDGHKIIALATGKMTQSLQDCLNAVSWQ
jgi:hypothetical protein